MLHTNFIASSLSGLPRQLPPLLYLLVPLHSELTPILGSETATTVLALHSTLPARIYL
jgi:hypothetical protein